MCYILLLATGDDTSTCGGAVSYCNSNIFPGLAFWQFLPPKPCLGPLKVRDKGPE